MKLTLASASPRRRELLSLLLDDFCCISTNIDETPWLGESPADYVSRMAWEKASAASIADGAVLGSDTVVVLGDEILQKPTSIEDARGMLCALSGQIHEVMTAVALIYAEETMTTLTTTRVQFAVLSEDLIASYLKSDEPWDKAGAYGIQGVAGAFVKRIEGSYSAVVGLPLYETRELLESAGIKLFENESNV